MEKTTLHFGNSEKNKAQSNNVTSIFSKKRADGSRNISSQKQSYPKTVIHIFGQNILQNDLLKNYFEQEAKFKCKWMAHDKIEMLQQANIGGMQLILLDCFGAVPEEVWLRHSDILTLNIVEYKIALMNLTYSYDWYFEKDAIRKGIKGVFYLGETASSVLKGVEKILDDELWFSRKTISKMLAEKSINFDTNESIKFALTAREREILTHLSSGAGNIEIAEKCCISLNTVKTHIQNIYKKIGVRNRLEATLWTAKYI